jgi:hypothetical protein
MESRSSMPCLQRIDMSPAKQSDGLPSRPQIRERKKTRDSGCMSPSARSFVRGPVLPAPISSLCAILARRVMSRHVTAHGGKTLMWDISELRHLECMLGFPCIWRGVWHGMACEAKRADEHILRTVCELLLCVCGEFQVIRDGIKD